MSLLQSISNNRTFNRYTFLNEHTAFTFSAFSKKEVRQGSTALTAFVANFGYPLVPQTSVLPEAMKRHTPVFGAIIIASRDVKYKTSHNKCVHTSLWTPVRQTQPNGPGGARRLEFPACITQRSKTGWRDRPIDTCPRFCK